MLGPFGALAFASSPFFRADDFPFWMEVIARFVRQATTMMANMPSNTEWPQIVAAYEGGNHRRIVTIMMFFTKENYIMICGDAPATFSVKGASFLDDDAVHLTISGFIHMVRQQFKYQYGENVSLWRDIPCDLTFIERCIITNGWVESQYSWLSPKCHKQGFHCKAHKLNKRLRFNVSRQLSGGEKQGIVEVIDQN